jgi:hypothetical protein
MADNKIEVEIDSGSAPGEYVVRVVHAPSGGEPEGTIHLAVDDLLERRQRIEETVLASSARARGAVAEELERPLRQVGHDLFEALFGGPVAGVYRSSQAVALDRGTRLRVVLRLRAPELSVLPWEALWDEAHEAYVCRREPLVRHVPAPSPEPLPVQPPLRILGLIASPRGLASLDVDAEQQQFEEALQTPVAEGRVHLEWEPHATWDRVLDRLLTGRWHVLHFVGHGDYDEVADEGRLALVGADGRADWVEASRLADLLGEAEPTPRLVVLNSCSGGAGGGRDLFSGTAATLVRCGISAVAAMQFRVSDRAAVAFPRGFYTALAAGRSVDEAVRSGRIAILGAPHSLEWVTPVLYLRGHTTHLFDLAPPAEGARPARPAEPTRAPTPETTPGAGAGDQRGDAGAAAPPLDPADRSPRGAATTAPPTDGGPPGPPTVDTSPPATPRPRAPSVAPSPGPSTFGAPSATGPPAPTAPPPSDGTTYSPVPPAPGSALGPPPNVLITHRPGLQVAQWRFGAAFTPDGSCVATYGGSWVRIWDAHTAAMRWQTKAAQWNAAARQRAGDKGFNKALAGASMAFAGKTPGTVTGMAFSSDGYRLVTGSDDATARLWDLDAGRQIQSIAAVAPLADVTGVAFGPDGARIATGGSDGAARVWDAATGLHLLGVNHGGPAVVVAFGPDGARLATAGADGTAHVWDATSGRPVATVRHAGPIRSVAFSPDGSRLATAGDDNVAHVWDAGSGHHLLAIAHPRAVRRVAYRGDGAALATACDDGAARVHDAATGDEIGAVWCPAPVTDVGFAPDGHRLVTASDDKVARIWTAPDR